MATGKYTDYFPTVWTNFSTYSY